MMVTGRLNSVFGLIPNVEKIICILLVIAPEAVRLVFHIRGGFGVSPLLRPPLLIADGRLWMARVTYRYGFSSPWQLPRWRSAAYGSRWSARTTDRAGIQRPPSVSATNPAAVELGRLST